MKKEKLTIYKAPCIKEYKIRKRSMIPSTELPIIGDIEDDDVPL